MFQDMRELDIYEAELTEFAVFSVCVPHTRGSSVYIYVTNIKMTKPTSFNEWLENYQIIFLMKFSLSKTSVYETAI